MSAHADIDHAGPVSDADALAALRDLSITSAHRTCLRALPSTLASLPGLGHLLPVLVEQGLVDCRHGVYARTALGDALLSAHDTERKRDTLRAIHARATIIRRDLEALRKSIGEAYHSLPGEDHKWSVRGAEVHAEHASDALWSSMCVLDAHLNPGKLVGAS